MNSLSAEHESMIRDGHVRRSEEDSEPPVDFADAVEQHRFMFGFLVLKVPPHRPRRAADELLSAANIQTLSSAFQPLGEEGSETGVSAERRAGEHEGGEEQAPGTVRQRNSPAHERPGHRSDVM